MSQVLWSAPSLGLRIVQTDEKNAADVGGLTLKLECCTRKDCMGQRQWDVVERTPVLSELLTWIVRHHAKLEPLPVPAEPVDEIQPVPAVIVPPFEPAESDPFEGVAQEVLEVKK